MTDIAVAAGPRSIDITSDAAKRRTRRRYRAEARFKAYGIAAILFAFLFLLFLITDIVIKAMPAFTLYNLTLDVTPTREDIDPDGTRDPAVIARGNYIASIRDSLYTFFPGVQEERRTRQKLNGILSSSGDTELRKLVVANPSLIGQSVSVPVLLSDDADLFYKGVVTDTKVAAGVGTASPSAASGDVVLLSTSNDFGAALVDMKRALSGEARRLRGEVNRFEELRTTYAAQATAAEAELAAARVSNPSDVPRLEGVVAKAASDAASIDNQIATLGQQAAAIEARFASNDPEALDARVPSMLIDINGGVIKVTEVADSQVKGTVLIPLRSADQAAPGEWKIVGLDTPEASRKLSDQEIAWLMQLEDEGKISSSFNWLFFTTGDSREAELAGILGALVGSAYTMLVTLVICLPIGICAAGRRN